MNNEQLIQRLNQVIRTDATDTSSAEFLATHIPFKNLKHMGNGETKGNGTVISEEAFLKEYLLANKEEHKLVIIKGNSGSGKSHFIRWLLENYQALCQKQQDEEEVIISIRRHQNTLKGAIEQILKAPVFQEIENKDLLKKLSVAQEQLSDDELIYSVKNNLLTKLESKREFGKNDISESENDKLVEFIKSKYVFTTLLGKENGAFDRVYKKISSNTNEVQEEIDAHFTAEDFSIDIDCLGEMELGDNDCSKGAIRFAKALYKDTKKVGNFRNEVAQYLNTMLDSVIQLCLQLSGEDFTSIFYELRQFLKLKNKRLTLFIEDITSFTGIDKSLLEALVVEHEGKEDICRVCSVIGITPGYYDKAIPNNIQQRITDQIIIDEKSVFTDEQDLVIMAARYMNAINLTAEELQGWVKKGAVAHQIPKSQIYARHTWSLFEDPLLGEVPLFPFNAKAVRSLYQTLPEKTPRVFLKQVIKYVYNRYLKDPEGFPGSWKIFEHYYKIPHWQNPLIEDKVLMQGGIHGEELSCILRVWGDQSVNRVTYNAKEYLGGLEEAVFKTFNVPFIGGDKVEQTVNSVAQPVQTKDLTGTKGAIINTQTTKEIVVTPTSVVDPTPIIPPQPVVKNKYMEWMQQLDHWLNKNEVLGIHKELRPEIAAILDGFINWEAHGVPTYVVKSFLGNKGTSYNRISIEGQKAAVIDEGIVLPRNQETYWLLRSLIAYIHLGNKSWKFDAGIDYLLKVQEWVDQHTTEIIEKIYPKALEKVFKCSVYNQYMCYLLEGKITGTETTLDLYKHLIEHIVLSNNPKRSAEWQQQISKIKTDLVEANYELMSRYHNILLGEAGIEGKKVFLASHRILEAIEELEAEQWQLNEKEISGLNIDGKAYIKPGELTKMLSKTVDGMLLTEKNLMIGQIGRIAKEIDLSEVTMGLYKIKSLLNKIVGNKENYNEEAFRLVLQSDEVIECYAHLVEETIEKINKLDEKQERIGISRLYIKHLSEYVQLLEETNKLLEMYDKKYESIIDANKEKANAYKEKAQETLYDLKIVKENFVKLGEEA